MHSSVVVNRIGATGRDTHSAKQWGIHSGGNWTWSRRWRRNDCARTPAPSPQTDRCSAHASGSSNGKKARSIAGLEGKVLAQQSVAATEIIVMFSQKATLASRCIICQSDATDLRKCRDL
jgi:hypothetical protein